MQGLTNAHEKRMPVSANDNTVALMQKSANIGHLEYQEVGSDDYNRRFEDLAVCENWYKVE